MRVLCDTARGPAQDRHIFNHSGRYHNCQTLYAVDDIMAQTDKMVAFIVYFSE